MRGTEGEPSEKPGKGSQPGGGLCANGVRVVSVCARERGRQGEGARLDPPSERCNLGKACVQPPPPPPPAKGEGKGAGRSRRSHAGQQEPAECHLPSAR